jgi:hypothetical protein
MYGITVLPNLQADQAKVFVFPWYEKNQKASAMSFPIVDLA